jgi:thiamine-monophosphate kinase
MIDVSDGLLADLGHILKISGVGARVELAKLPLSAAFAAYRHEPGEDPFLLPLTGGEDYELLFTVPPGKSELVMATLVPLGMRVTLLGEITAAGLSVIGADGSDHPVTARGYNHFSTVN